MFVVCLNARRIPENLTSLRALFKGVGFADLTLVTEGSYTGRSPGMLIYYGNRTERSPIYYGNRAESNSVCNHMTDG